MRTTPGVFILVALIIVLSGCAGVTTSTPAITVTLSPSSATVPMSQTQQFTATVKGSSDTAVTWEVNGTAGGNSAVGTISSSGLFTAPHAMPNPPKVSVTAVSKANPSVSASATITVTSKSPLLTITVSVTPLSGTVAAGATQQFTATVTGTTNSAVRWQVDGAAGGNATVGAISSGGLYTAPVTPPAGGSVVVTAIAAADATASGSANMQIVFSNASLKGGYAFSSEAVWTSVRTVGSFQADGKGGISQGSEDTVGSTSFTTVTFTGTYTIGADGRGTATFDSAGGTATFKLVVLPPSSVFLVEVDTSSDLTALAVRQDPTAFSTSALSGNYVFLLNSGLSGAAGRITADGQGNLIGVEDVNSFGTVSNNLALTGAYSVAASGRGTGTLTSSSGTTNLVFYVVSSGQVLILDDGPEVGSALKQTLQLFSNASLSGNYAFLEQGVANGQSLVVGGILKADGAGNLTGVDDQNVGETVTQNTSVAGSYSIASNGRGTATLSLVSGTLNQVFYLVDSTTVMAMDTDSTRMSGGRASLQQGNSFALASLKGSLGFGLVGFELSGGDLNLVGQLSVDGAGKIVGTEDQFVNNAANPSSSLAGSYAVGANGRGTGQVISANGTTNFLFYLTSPGTALVMGADSTAVNVGLIGQQF
ncbi:MAG: hypothetical protein WAR24_25925 [Candidatus Acidiferrales bacterium]